MPAKRKQPVKEIPIVKDAIKKIPAKAKKVAKDVKAAIVKKESPKRVVVKKGTTKKEITKNEDPKRVVVKKGTTKKETPKNEDPKKVTALAINDVKEIEETPTKKETPKKGSSAVKKPIKEVDCPLETYINTRRGDLILTCGTGEQIGHGERNTTKKPRGIMDSLPDDIVDVAAGGVHSVMLTSNGDIYSCGINEKGTIPLPGRKDDDSITEFTKLTFSAEIMSLGKFVSIAAGASFTAALTEHGSVLLWGDLRDAGGEMTEHRVFENLREDINILIDHRKGNAMSKIACGENHIICLSQHGELFTFGDPTKGQLGRVRGSDAVRQKTYYADNSGAGIRVPNIIRKSKAVKFKNVFAGGYWSAAISKEGHVYVCGLNNYDQLGFKADLDTKNAENRITSFKRSEIFEKSGSEITHFSGTQHIVVRYDNGEVWVIGRNIDNALGLGTWKGNSDEENWKSDHLVQLTFSDKIAGVTAGLGCSVAWSEDGRAFSWGADTSGQLGLGINDDDDEKMVAKPRQITSKHLEDKQIFKATISDNHCIFLTDDA
uniref:Regulator of chromosome condensation n=1 Tax=Rhabditophanes sp. KR3021 TaxID=114890 RepID=A0AC35U928_9BILA